MNRILSSSKAELLDALQTVYAITCRPRLTLVFLVFFNAAQEAHLGSWLHRQANVSDSAVSGGFGAATAASNDVGRATWTQESYKSLKFDGRPDDDYHRLLHGLDGSHAPRKSGDADPRLAHWPPFDSARCRDGYYDHRLRLVCPHEPKQPRSFSKRCQEVLQDFLESSFWKRIRRSDSTSPAAAHPPVRLYERIRSPTILGPIIGPWRLVLLLHSLFLIQLLSLLTETALVKALGLQPRLATFRPPRSWLSGKTLTRAWWRVKSLQGRRLFGEAAVAWMGAAWYLSVVATSAWRGDPLMGSSWPQWSIRRANSSTSGLIDWLLQGRSLPHPARALVLSDCLVTAIFLLQPVQCLLTGSLLPAFFDIPASWLRPSSRGARAKEVAEEAAPEASVQVESKWLLAVSVEAVACAAGILSYAVLALHSYRTLGFSVSVVFASMSITSLFRRLSAIRTSARRTMSCLLLVLTQLPAAPGSQVDPDWTCAICFEGESADDADGFLDGVRGKEHGRGRLRRTCSPRCGHVFHGECLVRWLHRAEWCPVCHANVLSPPSSSSSPSTVAPPSLTRPTAARLDGSSPVSTSDRPRTVVI